MFSEEGAMISNYGIEGMTYDMIDGKPVMYDDVRADFVSYRNSWHGLSTYQPPVVG